MTQDMIPFSFELRESDGFLCILDSFGSIIMNAGDPNNKLFTSMPKYIGFDTMDNAVLYRLSCE